MLKVMKVGYFMKKNIGILFGGESSEYEVSCKSASEILQYIDLDRYNPVKIGITKNGKWLITHSDIMEIANGNWVNCQLNRVIQFEMAGKQSSIYVVEDGERQELELDIVFPILHGKFGEDGCIQGLLELLNIPYVGCGVATSAIGFDKAFTKEIVNELDIEQANALILYKDAKNIDQQVAEVKEFFKNEYPLYVKPAKEGSSVGITKVSKFEMIEEALKTGYAFDNKLVIEKGIVGREVEVAVLGSKEIIVSEVGEILTDDFYSYDSKYGKESVKTAIVKDVDSKIIENVKEAALKIYKKLECTSLSRIDFFLREDGTFVFNEINTMPGFTINSMYPKLWEDKGITYTELITLLIEDSLKV